MNIGARIIFDKVTGNILANVGERSGNVTTTTPAQDMATYLPYTDPTTLDSIDFAYGSAPVYTSGNYYKVNTTTRTLTATAHA